MKKECCRNEDASASAWEIFRQFFEQNEEALVVISHETCSVIDANGAACRLFGSSREEIIHSGLRIFCSGDELENLQRLISSDVPVERPYVMTYTRSDGAKSVLRFRSSAIRLPNSLLVYCSFRDIGDEIRLKEENRFRRAQLIHANKMATLGMLVTSVAHEINNPNNFIMHNNQLLADVWNDAFLVLREHYAQNGDYYLGGIPLSEFEEVIPRLVYGISDGSKRIRNIVEGLRDFVRSDRARLDGIVDLAVVVTEAVALMRSEIDRHTGNCSVRCSKGLPRIRGSSQKLEQVVINLVMNALQSLTGRDKAVTIEVIGDAGKSEILLVVSDEGEGMSEAVMTSIMEPFFSTKLEKGGTGLGLYISNSIIREHRGTISFESTPRLGTKVTVRLPAAPGMEMNA